MQILELQTSRQIKRHLNNMSYCLFFDRNTQVVQDKSAVGHQCELCYVVHFGGGNHGVTYYDTFII